MSKIKTDSSVCWKAIWIQSPIYGGPRTGAPCPYFRKAFSLDQPVAQATLHITALGLYEAEINGKKVGKGELTPGWTEYHKRLHFHSYDVTSLLQAGSNAIGAILGDGWFCGHVAWMNRQIYGDRPNLLAQLEIRHPDGSTRHIVSDGSWKTTTGPILESDLLMGESYDARREIGEWSLPSCDESHWQPALEVVPEVDPALSISPIAPVRRIQEIAPVSAKPIGDHTKRGAAGYLYDLGQNFAGRVRIRVQAGAGRALILRHGEMLENPGAVHTANLRQARATDVYVCKSGDWETWEPRFTYHGFRYVAIMGFNPGDLCEVKGVVLHNDLEETGKLSCSNPLLNQLAHCIRWGLKSNFIEVPTDCPSRDERMGWTGDAGFIVETATFFMDVRAFYKKYCRDIRDTQGTEGDVPLAAPMLYHGYEIGKPGDGGPAWSDAIFICPWAVYRTYGDLEVLRDNYPAMKAYHQYLAKNRVKDGIRSHPDADPWGGFGDWIALDGSGDDKAATPKDLIGTAFYARDAEIMARTAALLGLENEAQAHWRKREAIVRAFRNRFCTPEGFLYSDTQTSYVLALKFNLLPDAARATAAARLASKICSNKNHLATGLVGTPHLLDVLEDHGYLDMAYTLLEQETCPSWLYFVKNGATTMWERWDGWSPEQGFHTSKMNSFNNHAFGSVGAWMVRSMAGLSQEEDSAGYERIVFRPRPGGTIKHSEATLKTARGEVGIAWSLKDGTLAVEVVVPSGSTARMDPPAGFAAASPLEVGPGRHQWTLRKILSTSAIASDK